jgi:hypothetical protein
MKASIVDLRYKMNEVLKALDRNETVQILYHGKVKGTIHPSVAASRKKVKEHPFFGMAEHSETPVSRQMERLRGSRYHAV